MTGKIFSKMILWVFLLMLLALVMVDYLATNVAQENYIQNLTTQLAEKGRMIAMIPPGPEHLDAETARRLARAAGGIFSSKSVFLCSPCSSLSMFSSLTPALCNAFRMAPDSFPPSA